MKKLYFTLWAAGLASMVMANNHGLCINEDSNNFFLSFPPEIMSVKGLERHAAYYADGQVVRVLYNTNGQRASHDSKVIEPIWTGVEEDAGGALSFRGAALDASDTRWIKHLLLFKANGIDPYKVWLEKTRACGREAWISDRMNDAHFTDNVDHYMHDKLWRNHPELRVPPCWGLDFGKAEVRENKLAYIRELLELWDMDGLELDFTRFPWVLSSGEGVPYLTSFILDARKLVDEAAKRRGHAIKFGLRIMSRPAIVRNLGFDLEALAKAKVADVVTVSNFWPCTDHDMPMEEWRKIWGDGVELDAGIELFSLAYPGGKQVMDTPELCAGYAAEYLYRGADRIYLFNHMIGYTGIHKDSMRADVPDYSFAYQDEAMQKIRDTMGSIETVYPATRRHVVSYATLDGNSVLLPVLADKNERELKLNVGGGTAGRKAFVVLGFENDPPEKMVVKVNGKLCTPCAGHFDRPCGVDANKTAMYQLPDGALQDGYNTVGFALTGGESAQIQWLEIFLP